MTATVDNCWGMASLLLFVTCSIYAWGFCVLLPFSNPFLLYHWLSNRCFYTLPLQTPNIDWKAITSMCPFVRDIELWAMTRMVSSKMASSSRRRAPGTLTHDTETSDLRVPNPRLVSRSTSLHHSPLPPQWCTPNTQSRKSSTDDVVSHT